MLQLGLALLAVGLAAYIGVSEYRKFQQRSQRDQFVGELRALAAGFEAYQAQKGAWPGATNAENRLPKGMEAALGGTRWLAGPPFGGAYDWLPPTLTPAPTAPSAPTPPPAENQNIDRAKKSAPGGLISITAFSPGPPLPLSRSDLLSIDRKLDDGNLSTGRFRTGFNGWPVYQVNPSR